MKRCLASVLTGWAILCGSANGRTILTADIILYVSAAGSDVNDCASSSTQCATIQRAWDVATTTLDLAGHALTIQLADGTYTAGLLATSGMLGASGGDKIVIQGNCLSPGNTIVSTTNTDAFAFGWGDRGSTAHATIKCLEIRTVYNGTPLLAGSGISAVGGAAFITVTNVRFGTVAAYHLSAILGAVIQLEGSYSVVGNARSHAVAAAAGIIHGHTPWAGVTVTFQNNPSFPLGFIYASAHGMQIWGLATFINGGAVTGPRFLCYSNSYVSVAGAGLNFLPGNSAGTTATGCIYE